MKVAILALGMSEKNDSVCNDVAYNYKFLSKIEVLDEVRIFAENYNISSFPDIPVEGKDEFYNWISEDPNVIVIFHYCDGNSEFDEFLRNQCKNLIIRWHNATPPWFTFGTQNQNAMHALTGYENIIKYIDRGDIYFWGNSDFTKDQLIALGAPSEHCKVVYPASRYLDLSVDLPTEKIYKQSDSLNLLFVSRVVPHKGHANAIALANRVQEITGKVTCLHIVGKGLDEPSVFTNNLKNIVASSKTKIIMHGLVSDEELISLYQSADVFICLSGHEGFGLPVFEAMRYRLPVVAWATTAFRDLLRKHPFASVHFDLDFFASAIATLDDPIVKRKILKIQSSILQGYNSDILSRQIADSLADFISNKSNGISDDLLRDSIRFLPFVANAINKEKVKLKNFFSKNFDDKLVFDSHVNITSLVDIRIFNEFLKKKIQLISSLTSANQQFFIKFRSDEFSTRKGVFHSPSNKTAHQLPITDISSDHLIFGPYIQIPVGKYEAEMGATIYIEDVNSVEFEFDVNVKGKQLAYGKTTIKKGQPSLMKSLQFSLDGDASLVELRLRSTKNFRGYIAFSGATLTKKDICAVKENIIYPLEKKKFQAKSFFERGDKARDKKDWQEAAHFYDLGLQLVPDDFAYIIQAAHMHKEIKNFEKAKNLYDSAYKINSLDADLCLQMGHFFKLINDEETSKKFYKKSLESYGKIAIDALNGLNLLS